MENIVVECTTDLSLLESTLSDIVVLLTTILDKINLLEKIVTPGMIQLNGYFYIIIFLLAGVGFFLLMYKFLKIFI